MIDQPPIYFLLSDGAIFLNQLFPVFVAAEIEPRVNVRSLFAGVVHLVDHYVIGSILLPKKHAPFSRFVLFDWMFMMLFLETFHIPALS